ncbi:MAG TPA: proline--tRNA ligase, partial [Chitinophagales bacterium]|nr:proline--tRNA ligase [Chitinophagales bacterium]
NYSEWYNDLVIQSGLAEYAAVRGCMVIKPYGWAIWENMKTVLDTKFKETGHVNASFPLLIPKGFLEQEEGHAEGFAKECAVVTHYRLKTNPDKKGKLMVDPESRLEEELIIRPTSETIIWNCYKGWIQSYRDLPILINQWANVMRWEMRTRLFLRTAEFHWQEGHTAHATSEEAVEETVKMLNVYADFMENYMAVPVIKGVKTANERFAGAVDTYCVEGLMQDGKALQCGTSHFLGQNFAKAFDVKFLTREGKQEYAWATSWGVSTRMMGALIMAHSDDEGLVIPPRLAPLHVVIVPIYKTEEQLAAITAIAEGIMKELKDLKITVKYDDNDQAKPGWKFAEYELKGVPVRIAMGGRDVENGTVEIARRDTKEKVTVKNENLGLYIQQLLEDIQQNLYNRALQFRTASTHEVDSWDDFKKQIEIGGFVSAHWDGTSETEEKIKEETKATIRCIPLDAVQENGNCVYSGKPSTQRVLFARAY